jgi:hypothetical protein
MQLTYCVEKLCMGGSRAVRHQVNPHSLSIKQKFIEEVAKSSSRVKTRLTKRFESQCLLNAQVMNCERFIAVEGAIMWRVQGL